MSEYSKVTPEIVEQIKAVVAPNRVYTGADINEDFSHDEMSIYGKAMPELVVDAVSTEEIAATMKIAYDNNIPVTARGAGTGLVGACVPIAGGIVINTTKMNKILEEGGSTKKWTPEEYVKEQFEKAIKEDILRPDDMVK